MHEADPVAVRDHAVLADHQGVVRCHVVRHEAVVGAGHLERQGGLLVLIVIKENVLAHPEAFSDAKMVEKCTLLSLELNMSLRAIHIDGEENLSGCDGNQRKYKNTWTLRSMMATSAA